MEEIDKVCRSSKIVQLRTRRSNVEDQYKFSARVFSDRVAQKEAQQVLCNDTRHNLRYSQILFNTFAEMCPHTAATIVATHKDPFYDQDNIQGFWTFIASLDGKVVG